MEENDLNLPSYEDTLQELNDLLQGITPEDRQRLMDALMDYILTGAEAFKAGQKLEGSIAIIEADQALDGQDS